MSFRMLELPQMVVCSTTATAAEFSLDFDGKVIKVMDGATQRTRWAQSGRIRIRHPQIENDASLDYPLEIEYGEIQDNIYVYQDIIRLPLHSSGNVAVEFHFDAASPPLIVRGDEIEVLLRDDPKYIEHID